MTIKTIWKNRPRFTTEQKTVNWMSFISILLNFSYLVSDNGDVWPGIIFNFMLMACLHIVLKAINKRRDAQWLIESEIRRKALDASFIRMMAAVHKAKYPELSQSIAIKANQ